MAVPLRTNNNKRGVLTYLKSLISSRNFNSSAPKGPVKDHSSAETESTHSVSRGRVDKSKWSILDARRLGITSSLISQASLYVLQLLQNKGFKSYLVGGCVRDLMLNRTPKDFDVITTAKLMEVRKLFRRVARADVVGRRFPICLVHIKGSVVEVTSFETELQTSNGSKKSLHSRLPRYNNEDLFLCKNSLLRDFTINSFFYDPFAYKIYGYANGMEDLRSLKLETVIPAQLSFKEDPGRILRGFRIAARLGLSISRETEAAIWKCSSLVKNLNQDKIMIEMNYMLSYGAAQPSLHLLWKFELLQFLLPVHAAYLDKQASKEGAQASNMLMKLFFHLDELVGCDRPSNCTLWVGLLAFHLALVNNPQDALVVWAFASVLYHGEWQEGFNFAKEHAKTCVNFVPEIKGSSIYKTDEEIAKAVTELASLVIYSIPALSRHASGQGSSIVFVSRKSGQIVSAIFKGLVNDIELYKSRRKSAKINYDMLGKGDILETGFVLGKIVLETMSSGIVRDGDDFEAEKVHLKTEDTKEIGHLVARKDKRKFLSTPNLEHRQEKSKKQKLVENGCIAEQTMGLENHASFKYKRTSEEHQKLVKLGQKDSLSMTEETLPKNRSSRRKQLIDDRRKIDSASDSSLDHARHLRMEEHDTCTEARSTVSMDSHQVVANNCIVNMDVTKDLFTTNDSLPKKSNHRKQIINDREKIAGAIKSSLDPARYPKMEENHTCTSSQSTVSKNHHQVITNNCDVSVKEESVNEVVSKKGGQQPRKNSNRCTSSQSTVSKNHRKVIAKSNHREINVDVTKDESVDEVVSEKGRQQPQKSKRSLPPLSGLFKQGRR